MRNLRFLKLLCQLREMWTTNWSWTSLTQVFQHLMVWASITPATVISIQKKTFSTHQLGSKSGDPAFFIRSIYNAFVRSRWSNVIRIQWKLYKLIKWRQNNFVDKEFYFKIKSFLLSFIIIFTIRSWLFIAGFLWFWIHFSDARLIFFSRSKVNQGLIFCIKKNFMLMVFGRSLISMIQQWLSWSDLGPSFLISNY